MIEPGGILHVPEDFSGKVSWESPSNIALVKYWGKTGNQIPANPSISFTLSESKTITSISFKRRANVNSGPQVCFMFEGKEAGKFGEKTFLFLKKIEDYFPFLKELELEIDTKNTFPHSSGIASSASGMSAMALCLMGIERLLNPEITEAYFYKKASFIARLGSGSACRSVYGGLTTWGESTISNSSNEIAIPLSDTHKVFDDFQDTILLIERGQKEVSSTVGHGLMHKNPFAQTRFDQARENTQRLDEILKSGNLEEFGALVESEALTLHAMMMTSSPYFMLMKPNTVEVIQKLWEYRKESGKHVYFTLDAGANVHLLYPKSESVEVLYWIKNELIGYCENQMYICDTVGHGPQELKND
ncbi:diphosphomevalonate decarboxylase [bacterium SCSIO 12643]|nr:diphosphomevalonate decarboxylase [bacterium SCSIO 12643]